MKKALILLAFILGGITINAQKFNDLDKSSMDVATFPKSRKISNKIIKVIYSRPKLKGRDLEELIPYGEVWRTGANEATEITFYKNLIFGGVQVEAGTYSLYTIPGEKEWEIILNKDLNVWGSSVYNSENDVVRVLAKATNKRKELEAFSLAFDKKMNLYMGWGNVLVTILINE